MIFIILSDVIVCKLLDKIYINHGFKNRTGPADSTRDRCPIQSGSLKKPENWKNGPKTENRRFNRKNRELERLNRFWPDSTNSKTAPFWPLFFPYPLP